MPIPNFSGCKLDCCLPSFGWLVEQILTILFTAALLYTGRFLLCSLSFSLFSVKETCTFHSFLITFCGPGFVDLHWSLPVSHSEIISLHVPDGRETRTRRDLGLHITFPSQATPAQGRRTGESDPRTPSQLTMQRKTNTACFWSTSAPGNQTIPLQIPENSKDALNSFQVLFWKLGIITMPGTLRRPHFSLVPSERAGNLKAESLFTDPTGIWNRTEEYCTPRHSAILLKVGR